MVVGIQESHSECNQREAREEVQTAELKESLQKNKSDAKVCSSLTITEELERDKKVQNLLMDPDNRLPELTNCSS